MSNSWSLYRQILSMLSCRAQLSHLNTVFLIQPSKPRLLLPSLLPAISHFSFRNDISHTETHVGSHTSWCCCRKWKQKNPQEQRGWTPSIYFHGTSLGGHLYQWHQKKKVNPHINSLYDKRWPTWLQWYNLWGVKSNSWVN